MEISAVPVLRFVSVPRHDRHICVVLVQPMIRRIGYLPEYRLFTCSTNLALSLSLSLSLSVHILS